MRKFKGFSLIELIFVVSVFSIFAVLLFFYLGSKSLKGRDLQRRVDLKRIQAALAEYKDDNNGTYPFLLSLLAPKYLSKIPKDPKTKSDYLYKVSDTKTYYEINAFLEDKKNALSKNDNGNNPNVYEVGDNLNLLP